MAPLPPSPGFSPPPPSLVPPPSMGSSASAHATAVEQQRKKANQRTLGERNTVGGVVICRPYTHPGLSRMVLEVDPTNELDPPRRWARGPVHGGSTRHRSPSRRMRASSP